MISKVFPLSTNKSRSHLNERGGGERERERKRNKINGKRGERGFNKKSEIDWFSPSRKEGPETRSLMIHALCLRARRSRYPFVLEA